MIHIMYALITSKLLIDTKTSSVNYQKHYICLITGQLIIEPKTNSVKLITQSVCSHHWSIID